MDRRSSCAGAPPRKSASGRSAARRSATGTRAEAMVARPFTVLGVQQIALGSRDRIALRSLWVDCLGLTSRSTFQSAAENVDEEILSVGLGIGRVEVDLMQPVDASARPV